MSGIEYWIWFASLRGLTYHTRRAALERFATAKGIFFADKSELLQLEGITSAEADVLLGRELSAAANTLRRCEELNIGIVTIQDAVYPERLRNIPDPPYVLYVKGRLPAIDSEAVIGVVGTRSSTPYGDKMARNIAYEIAAKGGIVATGLAGGIDSRAAEGALMAGGKVIGVLGTAINEIYPKWNTALFADVQTAGVLISEYPPDVFSRREWFPARNRIIAGLSLGVVIGEAPLKSGALITAKRALDYGRDVFAVPGNADAPACRGSNHLLREGAMIAENGWDVLKEYKDRFPERITEKGKGSIPEEQVIPEKTRQAEAEQASSGRKILKLRRAERERPQAASVLENQLSALSETQLKIVGVMTEADMHIDDIIELCRIPASAVLSELTLLQIKGVVRQGPGKRFSLNIMK